MGQWYVEPSVTRLDLGDGQWVEVRRELTYGDAQELAGLSMRVKGELTDKAAKPEMEMHWAEFQLETLFRWIVAWSATDAEGKAIPLNRQTIRMLPADTGNRIAAALRQHQLDVERAKN